MNGIYWDASPPPVTIRILPHWSSNPGRGEHPGCLLYIGDGNSTPVMLVDYVRNHEISESRKIKQPVLHGKSPSNFCVAHLAFFFRLIIKPKVSPGFLLAKDLISWLICLQDGPVPVIDRFTTPTNGRMSFTGVISPRNKWSYFGPLPYHW